MTGAPAVGVIVGVRLAVRVGVRLAVAAAVCVRVGVRLWVAVATAVRVAVGARPWAHGGTPLGFLTTNLTEPTWLAWAAACSTGETLPTTISSTVPWPTSLPHLNSDP